MKSFLKTLSVFAACAIAAASMASCGQDTSWTYRTEDGNYEVTSGMYVGLSINAYNEGYSQSDIDTSTALYDQQIESQDALTWVTTRTDTLAKRYLAVESKFDEYGLSFNDDTQSYIDSYISYYWSYYSSSYEAQGCAEKSYTKLITNSFKESELFFTIYGEGGEKEVSADDLRAIFDEEYAHINTIQIDASDEDGNALTGDDLTAKQEEADALVERVKAGESFEDVKTDYNSTDEDSDTSDESSEEETAASDTSSYILESNTTYPSDLVTKIFAADIGDCGSYDDGNGTIYVWTRLATDDTGFETYRTTILQNEKWDEYSNLVTDWVNSMTFTTNDAAIKKHTPKNLEK